MKNKENADLDDTTHKVEWKSNCTRNKKQNRQEITDVNEITFEAEQSKYNIIYACVLYRVTSKTRWRDFFRIYNIK